jgi:hypothetical protein
MSARGEIRTLWPVAMFPVNLFFQVAEDSERLSDIRIELFISLDSEGNSSYATIINVSFHLVARIFPPRSTGHYDGRKISTAPNYV